MIKNSKMPGLQNNNNGSGSNQWSQNRGTRSSGKKWYKSRSGSNNQTTKAKANNQPKARELKFHLHGTDSSKKTEIFEKIKDNIVSRIKRTFVNTMDIAQSIQDGARKSYEEPVLDEPTETDPDKKAREEKMITLKFQIDYEHWIKEENSFKENWVKAYAMIMDQYCAKDVQVALKE